MKVSLKVPMALTAAFLFISLSGCVIRDHETVHDGGYAQGYKEGYYDRDHNRYWHENGWHDCEANDSHCH